MQLQTENARLKKNVSEVTAQSMAVNSRHLDSASKLRESIVQLTENIEKTAKELETAEAALTEMRKAKECLEQANAELTEKLSAVENSKQNNVELDNQVKKVNITRTLLEQSNLLYQFADELKFKSSKLDELTAKLVACGHTNNGLTNKLKELTAEKV
jgi:hypothetical protein